MDHIGWHCELKRVLLINPSARFYYLFDAWFSRELVCVQQVLDDANKGTFRELASFARAQHSSPSKRRSTCTGYQRLLPAALTVAGGVNSSDHARTFPDLVSLLRSQVFLSKLIP